MRAMWQGEVSKGTHCWIFWVPTLVLHKMALAQAVPGLRDVFCRWIKVGEATKENLTRIDG